MTQKTIILSWVSDGGHVTYLVDGVVFGANGGGFDRLLDRLAKDKEIKKLIISYPVRGLTGGQSPVRSFPFFDRHERLLRIARENGISIELSSDLSK